MFNELHRSAHDNVINAERLAAYRARRSESLTDPRNTSRLNVELSRVSAQIQIYMAGMSPEEVVAAVARAGRVLAGGGTMATAIYHAIKNVDVTRD